MYRSKKKALAAYSAYLAITHTEAFVIYLRFVVERVRKLLSDNTTSKDIAQRIVMRIRVLRKKKKKK